MSTRPSPEQLILRFYESDSPSEECEALEEFVRSVAPALRAYLQGLAARAGMCADQIDDVLADAWAVLWRGKNESGIRFDPQRGRCMAWLYRVVANRFIDYVRRRL